MRVELIGITTIDWETYLEFAKHARPTKDIDSTNLKYSPAGAWSMTMETMFQYDPGTFHMLFLVETDYPLELLHKQMPVKAVADDLVLICGTVQELVEAIIRITKKETSKELRLLGNGIYTHLYRHAREFVKDFKKQDLGDGTWALR